MELQYQHPQGARASGQSWVAVARPLSPSLGRDFLFAVLTDCFCII